MANELTYDERKEIERLIKETPYSLARISRILKRGKNTVVAEVRRCGGRHLYTADAAQQRAVSVRKEGIMKIIKRNKGQPGPYFPLKEEIERLKMQVQILTETIRGMIENENK